MSQRDYLSYWALIEIIFNHGEGKTMKSIDRIHRDKCIEKFMAALTRVEEGFVPLA